jgi:hypothetical protein
MQMDKTRQHCLFVLLFLLKWKECVSTFSRLLRNAFRPWWPSHDYHKLYHNLGDDRLSSPERKHLFAPWQNDALHPVLGFYPVNIVPPVPQEGFDWSPYKWLLIYIAQSSFVLCAIWLVVTVWSSYEHTYLDFRHVLGGTKYMSLILQFLPVVKCNWLRIISKATLLNDLDVSLIYLKTLSVIQIRTNNMGLQPADRQFVLRGSVYHIVIFVCAALCHKNVGDP